MKKHSELIVMLTHHDQTVQNASEIFEMCRNSRADFWGMKESPLPQNELKRLFGYMKQCQKKTVLEVVAYTEAECLTGAETAVECSCDILMGTHYFDSVHEICRQHGIRYMPFIGDVSGRPSVLNGSIEAILQEAETCLEKGVYGFDLLGYRTEKKPELLIRKFLQQIDAPVCVAGSINSWKQLDFLKQVKPWAFTVGGAFFENKFDGTFCEQINRVCDYMNDCPNERRLNHAETFLSI